MPEESSEEDYQTLKNFALVYPEFLNDLYSGLIESIDILKKWYEEILKIEHHTIFQTIDGFIAQYNIYKTVRYTRSIYNPVTKTGTHFKLFKGGSQKGIQRNCNNLLSQTLYIA